MINLASRDILAGWGKFLLTGAGLGLLIGVTLSMAGIYRGMVDDEPSSVRDDRYRGLLGLSGVAETGNVTYLTMQVAHNGRERRVMVVGFEPGHPGEPGYLIAGRPITRSHYELVADIRSGFMLGERVKIRRQEYTVVGLTRRMVSSNGDPMLFLPLKDAQAIQFLKDNPALRNERARTAANPAFNRPAVPGLLQAVQASQATSHFVNAVLLRLDKGADAQAVAAEIRRWKYLQAYTKAEMEEIMVAKIIATASKQILMFLIILAIVSAAIVAFIIYTMTMNKVREIAVLKLIGGSDRTIAMMIMQQAMGLGFIGFIVGKLAATLWAPVFPKYVLLLPWDALFGLLLVLAICAAASTIAIRAAISIDPATAIGG